MPPSSLPKTLDISPEYNRQYLNLWIRAEHCCLLWSYYDSPSCREMPDPSKWLTGISLNFSAKQLQKWRPASTGDSALTKNGGTVSWSFPSRQQFGLEAWPPRVLKLERSWDYSKEPWSIPAKAKEADSLVGVGWHQREVEKAIFWYSVR